MVETKNRPFESEHGRVDINKILFILLHPNRQVEIKISCFYFAKLLQLVDNFKSSDQGVASHSQPFELDTSVSKNKYVRDKWNEAP